MRGAWPEDLRLEALHDMQLIGAPPQPSLDRIVGIARRMFSVPIALVSLVGHDRQWFISRTGMEARETPRSVSFCSHAVAVPERPFVIEDATGDPRFAGNPLVTGTPHIRFYAGAVIRAPNGAPIGTICVIDTIPRPGFSDADCRSLSDLASLATDELLLRETARELETGMQDLRVAYHRLEEENERNRHELAAAAAAQRRILPASPRRLAGMSVASMLLPSRGVSGDAYGYGRLGPETSFFWIADIAGHGVAAALLAASLSRVITGELLVDSATHAPRTPADVLVRLNERMFDASQEDGTYFTMIYGIARQREAMIEMALAGHPPPLLLAPGQPPAPVEESGLPLALFETVSYDPVILPMPPGSRILLYTDGLQDCWNRHQEPFDLQRLSDWMTATIGAEPAAALDELERRVRTWRGVDYFADDIAAILVDRDADDA